MRGFAWRQEQETWRTAEVVAALYNVNRNPKKRRQPITAEDVMGRKRNRRRKGGARTPEEQFKVLKNLTLAMGGEIRRRPRAAR
ncbi:MAG TPA: hypothetical protein VK979_04215 [Guyparkeria sp.]|nr:hypothetical protein [Guyparkeria sp.]